MATKGRDGNAMSAMGWAAREHPWGTTGCVVAELCLIKWKDKLIVSGDYKLGRLNKHVMENLVIEVDRLGEEERNKAIGRRFQSLP